jgi:hypothetical protein
MKLNRKHRQRGWRHDVRNCTRPGIGDDRTTRGRSYFEKTLQQPRFVHEDANRVALSLDEIAEGPSHNEAARYSRVTNCRLTEYEGFAHKSLNGYL